MHIASKRIIVFSVLATWLLVGCALDVTLTPSAVSNFDHDATPTSTPLALTPTATVTPALTLRPTATLTPRPTATNTSSGWERYQQRSFQELLQLTEEILSEMQGDTTEKLVYLEMSPYYQYPSRLNVLYTGEFRETPTERLDWLVIYLGAFSSDLTESEVRALFANELLVEEEGVIYWMAVQSALVTRMQTFLAQGDVTELFVVWMGAADDGETQTFNRLFIVNAFRELVE